ncbi:hypothetical protein EPUS_09272 [Endocarpon pusillum Z07020]|uniref:Uncharacterized protein n=1 Tax=Endocarpon pusillum (strain Z07020 / HMAS-L-300199) TaxID=1263415 RepID=U1I0Y4_ENDPU|nr:uncharacterized protein EPUS_09272 [Endocarpon pusillum Z07020]ERF75549.1 hypothetical protein EPUS_09272 [Endocarpon pusillum Z07020]
MPPLPSQSEQSISLESSSQRPRTSSWLKAEAERHQQEQPVLKTRKHSLSTETGGIVTDGNPETAPSKSTGERAATPFPKPVQCKGRYTIEDLYPEENRNSAVSEWLRRVLASVSSRQNSVEQDDSSASSDLASPSSETTGIEPKHPQDSSTLLKTPKPDLKRKRAQTEEVVPRDEKENPQEQRQRAPLDCLHRSRSHGMPSGHSCRYHRYEVANKPAEEDIAFATLLYEIGSGKKSFNWLSSEEVQQCYSNVEFPDDVKSLSRLLFITVLSFWSVEFANISESCAWSVCR